METRLAVIKEQIQEVEQDLKEIVKKTSFYLSE
jgi:hypothetical protein